MAAVVSMVDAMACAVCGMVFFMCFSVSFAVICFPVHFTDVFGWWSDLASFWNRCSSFSFSFLFRVYSSSGCASVLKVSMSSM